jgi:hypothetical protein
MMFILVEIKKMINTSVTNTATFRQVYRVKDFCSGAEHLYSTKEVQ